MNPTLTRYIFAHRFASGRVMTRTFVQKYKDCRLECRSHTDSGDPSYMTDEEFDEWKLWSKLCDDERWSLVGLD